MTRINQSFWMWIGIVWAVGLTASTTHAEKPKKPVDEVEALIDRLTEVDKQDFGYSASTGGASVFSPLVDRTRWSAWKLGTGLHGPSEDLKSLVKLGAKALPELLKHLDDARPTKITLTLSGDWVCISQDQNEGAGKVPLGFPNEGIYTIMVGDLCYVAIGQIVNRKHEMACYIPTGICSVRSVPKSRKVREQVIEEWSNLSAEKHRESLARDLESDNEHIRNGAVLRLACYYPEALEPLAIKQLGRPGYPGKPGSLDSFTQARFLETLKYDRSVKLDRAIRDLLAKTDDVGIAKGCLDRLVGRGFDAEIETYLKRRLPRLNPRQQQELLPYQAKLGWTRLHAAVDLGVPELLEHHADRRAKDSDSRTPLALAKETGNAAVIKLLEEAK